MLDRGFKYKERRENGAPRASAPTGIRTPVLALKGPRPSPLDDGGGKANESIAERCGGIKGEIGGKLSAIGYRLSAGVLASILPSEARG